MRFFSRRMQACGSLLVRVIYSGRCKDAHGSLLLLLFFFFFGMPPPPSTDEEQQRMPLLMLSAPVSVLFPHRATPMHHDRTAGLLADAVVMQHVARIFALLLLLLAAGAAALLWH